jgi:hypothetical protein
VVSGVQAVEADKEDPFVRRGSSRQFGGEGSATVEREHRARSDLCGLLGEEGVAGL